MTSDRKVDVVYFGRPYRFWLSDEMDSLYIECEDNRTFAFDFLEDDYLRDNSLGRDYYDDFKAKGRSVYDLRVSVRKEREEPDFSESGIGNKRTTAVTESEMEELLGLEGMELALILVLAKKLFHRFLLYPREDLMHEGASLEI